MKSLFLFLSCLVLTALSVAADGTFDLTSEDPTGSVIDGVPQKRAEDQLLDDPTGSVIDGVPQKREEDQLLDDPTGNVVDGVPQKGTEDQLLDDNKFFLNGEEVGPEDVEFDSVEDPIDAETVNGARDEMDNTAEDPALYGWTKHPFSWCTVQGRSEISRDVNNPIDYLECQRRCEARPGCKAIEFWEKYNYACFVCLNPSLITPYTNQNDLAYPAHVWVQNENPSPTTSPTETTPAETTPAETTPAETTPAETTPAETTPAETTPAETTPAETTPAEPTKPSPSQVNVTCGKDEMYISIPKNLLHGLDRDHLSLTDVNCGATETQTHFILHTRLTECHTTSRHTKDFVCYMNKVEEIPVEHHQIITRVREVEIPFSCYYSNMGVVSAVGLQVKSKKIIFSKKGYGEFVLEMKIFPDHKYLGEYKKKDFPVYVPLRKVLFVEVSVDTEDSRLEILAEECFATPDPDPNKPGLKYTFIKDGCAIDETVTFIPSADERTQRFSLEAFKFLGDHQFVYMHCKVKICNATDPNSRCAQGCLHDRRRRSLYTQETNDEEYTLAQGPFMRSAVENDETEISGMRDLKTSGQYNTVIAAMAVVAAVCVVGVSYFAWDKKKRSAVRDYQLLRVASED